MTRRAAQEASKEGLGKSIESEWSPNGGSRVGRGGLGSAGGGRCHARSRVRLGGVPLLVVDQSRTGYRKMTGYKVMKESEC